MIQTELIYNASWLILTGLVRMILQRVSSPGCYWDRFLWNVYMMLLNSLKLFGLSGGAVAIALGAAVAGNIYPANTAHAQSINMSYSLHMVGLPLGSARLSGQVTSKRYKISAFAKLGGIARMISNAKGAATSSGRISGNRIFPVGYATSSSSKKRSRTVQMGMSGRSVRRVRISPPIKNKPGRIPLRSGHKRNIIDPLSALIFPISKAGVLNGPAICSRAIPIFDGYTRFDVLLSYSGTRTVSSRGYNGRVIVCKARYRPIAGHRPHRKATRFMVNNRDMEVWLAPLPNSRVMIPYRIAVQTLIGKLDIRARNFPAGSSRRSTATR